MGVLPPLTGVAVNVTDEPVQVGLNPEVIPIVTDGATCCVTVIVMVFDVTTAAVTHGAVEVIVQVTV